MQAVTAVRLPKVHQKLLDWASQLTMGHRMPVARVFQRLESWIQILVYQIRAALVS